MKFAIGATDTPAHTQLIKLRVKNLTRNINMLGTTRETLKTGSPNHHYTPYNMITKKITPHLSSKQMREWIDQHNFLRDCKTKGFKRLQSMGRFRGGIQLCESKPTQERTSDFDALDFAQKAAQMVRDGSSITSAAAKFGRRAGELRYYCDKFKIECISQFGKGKVDYDETYKKLLYHVNRMGQNMSKTSRILNCTPQMISTILNSKGRKYNAKTKKIERITKS